MNEQDAREKFRKADERWLGRFGEALWEKVFVASQIRYVPLCKIEDGGAPLMKGGDGDAVILPDFSINGKGWAAYLDAKCKKNVVMFRKASQLRHGIDQKNYLAYQTAGYLDRRGCGLGVVELFRETCEEWSGSLLVESFRNLGRPIAGFSNQAHMVYWPRKQFRDLDSLTAAELLDVANGEKQVRYSDELNKVFAAAEPGKTCMFDAHSFEDVQVADGRTRRVCKTCGKFYGYVPKELFA